MHTVRLSNNGTKGLFILFKRRWHRERARIVTLCVRFPICYYDYSGPKINLQRNDNENVNLAFSLDMKQARLEHKCLSTNRKQFKAAMEHFP
jgi:hypothetical protein